MIRLIIGSGTSHCSFSVSLNKMLPLSVLVFKKEDVDSLNRNAPREYVEDVGHLTVGCSVGIVLEEK